MEGKVGNNQTTTDMDELQEENKQLKEENEKLKEQLNQRVQPGRNQLMVGVGMGMVNFGASAQNESNTLLIAHTNELSNLREENRKLNEENKLLAQQVLDLTNEMQQLKVEHTSNISKIKKDHDSDISSLRSELLSRDEIILAFELFVVLKEYTGGHKNWHGLTATISNKTNGLNPKEAEKVIQDELTTRNYASDFSVFKIQQLCQSRIPVAHAGKAKYIDEQEDLIKRGKSAKFETFDANQREAVDYILASLEVIQGKGELIEL
jgi:hypothetical protein